MKLGTSITRHKTPLVQHYDMHQFSQPTLPLGCINIGQAPVGRATKGPLRNCRNTCSNSGLDEPCVRRICFLERGVFFICVGKENLV